MAVGPNFWSNATRWCASGLPACALPLTRYQPTSSMGLYDADFLRSPAALSNISSLKNVRGVSGMRWKIRGVGWEDKLFKVCDAVSPVLQERLLRYRDVDLELQREDRVEQPLRAPP